jgi:hypothetical protein
VAAESCPGSSCSNFSLYLERERGGKQKKNPPKIVARYLFLGINWSQKLRFSKQTHLEDGFAFDPDVVTAASFRKEPAGPDGIAKTSLVSLVCSIDFKGPF